MPGPRSQAAKALLSAAGVPNTSTATEHATSSSPAATRREAMAKLQTTVRIKAEEDDFDDIGIQHIELENIVALLVWMAQDFRRSMILEEIHMAALDTIIKHTMKSNL